MMPKRGDKCRWRIIRNTMLAMVVIMVIIILILPITLFCIFRYTDNTSQHSSILYNDSNNTNNIHCDSELTWSEHESSVNDTDEEQCTINSYEYKTSGICNHVLQEWNYCITNSNTTSLKTIVSYNKSQDILNQNIQDIYKLLNNFRECQTKALLFLCQYYFPLIDCYNSIIYSAARDVCNNISTTVCAVPWKFALLTEYADKLPECDLLEYSNNTDNNTTDFQVNSNLSCRDDFFLLNDSCVPSCEKFSISKHTDSMFEYSCQVIAGISGIVAFVIVMIYTVIERKRIIQFPTIFTLFLLTDCGIAGFTILLSVSIGSKPFCSSPNLIETLQNKPTGFCIFSGVVFHYTLVSMTVWWFIHLAVLVFRVAFPFTAQRMKDNQYFKYVYWILLIIGFLCPVPSIAVSLTTEDNRYNINELPPHTCKPSTTMWFYSQMFPINILLGIGVCLLSYIIWILNKMRMGTLSTKKRFAIGPGERKLIIVFILYLVFGIYAMGQSITVIGYEDILRSEIVGYFQCEQSGHIPGKCNRSGFEKYRFPYFIGFLYLLLSLTPFSVLSFVINWSECFKKIKDLTAKKGEKKTSVTSIRSESKLV